MMMMMMTKKINYLFIKVIKNSIINYIKDLYLHIINDLQMDENNFWRENIFCHDCEQFIRNWGAFTEGFLWNAI